MSTKSAGKKAKPPEANEKQQRTIQQLFASQPRRSPASSSALQTALQPETSSPTVSLDHTPVVDLKPPPAKRRKKSSASYTHDVADQSRVTNDTNEAETAVKQQGPTRTAVSTANKRKTKTATPTASAKPAAARVVVGKRVRRTKTQMEADFVAKSSKGVNSSKCDFCDKVFVTAVGHGCVAESFLSKIVTSVTGKEEPVLSSTYEAVDTTCVKMFLNGMLSTDASRAAFAKAFIQRCVIQQHRLRMPAHLLVYGFIVDACQSITLDNVGEFVKVKVPKPRKRKAKDGTVEDGADEFVLEIKDDRLALNQHSMHTALVLVSSRIDQSQLTKTTPLHEYFFKKFNLDKYPNIKREAGSDEYLNQTSLQYLALQMRTDFANMMEKQLWTVTTSWVRKEMADLDPKLLALFSARSVVMRTVTGWILHCAIGTEAVSKFVDPSKSAKQPRGAEAIAKAAKAAAQAELNGPTWTGFMACMKTKLKEYKYFEGIKYQKAWEALFAEIRTRCLTVLVEVLLPFEQASAKQKVKLVQKGVSPTAVVSHDPQEQDSPDAEPDYVPEQHDPDKKSSTAREGAKDYTACRRAEWLSALLKRLEQLESRAVQRFNDTQSSAPPASEKSTRKGKKSRKDPHPPRFKLSNVFPLIGWVPGSIMFTEELLQCMAFAYETKLYNEAVEVELKRKTEKESEMEIDEESKEQDPFDPPALPIKPSKKTMDRHAWMKFFRVPPQYWKSLVVPNDRSSVRLRNKFTCDGISMSVIETSIVTKNKYIPLEVEKDDEEPPILQFKPKLDYVNGLDMDSLREKNIGAILTLDFNRKNYAKGIIRKIGDTVTRRLPPDDDEMEEERKNDPEADEFRSVNPFATLLDDPHYDRADKEKRRLDRCIEEVEIVISKSEYKHCRKIKQQAQLRMKLEQLERKTREGRLDIFAMPPTLKSSSPQTIHTLLAFLNTSDGFGGSRYSSLMDFYSKSIFRRLRMESYMAQQEWWVYVQDKIHKAIPQAWNIECGRKKPAHMQWIHPTSEADVIPGEKRTEDGRVLRSIPGVTPMKRLLVVLGDGSFRHNSAGHITMPTGHRFFAAFRLLGEEVFWVDEFRTSMCCSSCGSEMEQALLLKKADRKREPPDRPNIVERQARQLERWNAKRRDARKSLTPSPRPMQTCEIRPPHHTSSQIPPSQLATETDPEFLPSVPFLPKYEHSGQRRYSPTIKPGSMLSRCPKAVSAVAADHKPSALISPWGLRYCSGCNRLWCRDNCASRNMMSRTLWLLRQKPNDPIQPPFGVTRSARVRPPHKLDGPSYLRRQARVTTDSSSNHSLSTTGNEGGHEPLPNDILLI